MALATARVQVTGGRDGSLEDTDTPTYRHRHADIHTLTTRLSLVLFPFAHLGLSALCYSSCVRLATCRLHPAPLLIAQQHALQGTITISLTRAVPEHSCNLPPSCPRHFLLHVTTCHRAMQGFSHVTSENGGWHCKYQLFC